MKSMETGRQDGGSDKNHAPFSVGKTGNISRKFLTIILKIFDKNFERLQERILEELYDKKKEWYYVIMDICILQMSYEEAAKHLNIEVQVLRARLYRARRYIRKKYGEEYQEL